MTHQLRIWNKEKRIWIKGINRNPSPEEKKAFRTGFNMAWKYLRKNPLKELKENKR